MLHPGSGITFLNPIPVPLFLLMAAVIGGFLFFSYVQFSVLTRTKLRIALAALRTFAVILAVFFILDPYWSQPSDSDWLGVLVDTSKSMNIQDNGAKASRLEDLKTYFTKDHYWSGLQKGKLREYLSFDSEMRSLPNLTEMKASGDSSRLISAMHEIDTRFRDDPNLTGWILFTDGGATDLPHDQKEYMTEVGFPWLIVGTGLDGEVPNLHLDYPVLKEPIFVGDVVNTSVKWESTFPAKSVTRLSIKLDGKAILDKEVSLDDKHYDLEFTFKESGNHYLDIEMLPLAGEGSDADNRLRVAIKAHTRETRVFYGESFYKDHNFFKEALEEDSSFKVTFASSVIGFSRKNRLPFIKDAIYGFPRTRNDLLQYDVIVLSDVKRNLLTTEQIDWIRELVEKEGGALIMVGGVDSFGDGGYVGTPIEKMLPVEISEDYKQKNFLKARGVNENPFRPVVASGAEAHPLLQITANATQNKLLWESMPLLGGYNNVGRLKPAATALLLHPSDTSAFGPRVIMASQNFGKGKVLAFTSDITPNWGEWFQAWKDEKEGWVYAKLWRSILKWMTENRLRGRASLVEITREPVLVEAFKPVQFTASLPARDETQPRGDLKFEIIKGKDLVLSEIFKDPESQQVIWKVPHLETGDYVIKALYEVKGELPIIAESPFTVHPTRVEAEHLKMNPELLKKLADETQGVYLPFNRIASLDDSMTALRKANLRRRSKPFWNHLVFYLIFIGILCLDWFARKKRGLE